MKNKAKSAAKTTNPGTAKYTEAAAKHTEARMDASMLKFKQTCAALQDIGAKPATVFNASGWSAPGCDITLRIDFESGWPIVIEDLSSDTVVSVDVEQARGLIVALTEAVAACDKAGVA